MLRLEDYNFRCIQGSFRLFCRRKLGFSNNLECGWKKVTVTNNANFVSDPNCLQAFLFQRHLPIVVNQNDMVKHDRFKLPYYIINIHSEIVKTVEFEYTNSGDLVR